MTAINETQKLVKDLIISQGEKNIILIQMFYNVPRIVRLTGGDLAYIKPQIQQAVPQEMPDGSVQEVPVQIPPLIQIYQEDAQKELQAIEEIEGDLSLGEYEIDIIAGTEMPRSRSEKAQIYMQLAQMGKIPETASGTELLLDALDIPDKTAIMDAIQEAQSQRPQIQIAPDLLAKIFKDMPLDQQLQALAQFGFQIPSLEEEIQINQLTK